MNSETESPGYEEQKNISVSKDTSEVNKITATYSWEKSNKSYAFENK